MSKKKGEQTIVLTKAPSIIAKATVAGPKEGNGPLRDSFDKIHKQVVAGNDSFEKTELIFLKEACQLTYQKKNLKPEDIDYFLAGDLLNQIISASYCARDLNIPFIGLFGACSTLAEALALAAMLIDGDCAEKVLVATSSHNCSVERQYRYPTEYGAQKPKWSQWTATGAGAALLAKEGEGPKVEAVTIGKVIDGGIRDPYNMGAAMAPAAFSTIKNHLSDLQREPDYYDLILTGDLGEVGKELLMELMHEEGLRLDNYSDCGLLLYYPHQQVNAGGSGCATSALVFLGYYYDQMMKKEIKKMLLVATGSLHSPTSVLQGESMPGIAHAISLII